MEISELNISIDLFNSKEQMEKFLGLAGFNGYARYIIFKSYEGIVWSKTKDGQYALYLPTLNVLDNFLHFSN